MSANLARSGAHLSTLASIFEAGSMVISDSSGPHESGTPGPYGCIRGGSASLGYATRWWFFQLWRSTLRMTIVLGNPIYQCVLSVRDTAEGSPLLYMSAKTTMIVVEMTAYGLQKWWPFSDVRAANIDNGSTTGQISSAY